jgi:solute carrier family 25 (mitochondrial carnitine/acylcarnitine transporter), member 20/29
VIGFPLDLIKTRMQTAIGNNKASHSIFSMGRDIVQKEGVFGLYRGLVPPLLSLSTLNILTFTSYSYLRQSIFEANNGWDIRNGLSGACIGPLASSISTVENLVKTQMQMDNVRGKQFHGSLHCLRTLTAQHGLQIIYTGHVVNTAREGVFLGCYFTVYEGFREMLFQSISATGSDAPTHKWAIPLSGGLAGSIAWFVSFPLDCIRAGVQGQSFDHGATRKKSLDVTMELVKAKGIRGLYSGVSPSIMRAFLVSGSRFSAYEGALWLIRGGRDNTRYKE